ncbi:MAG: hypothetical protein ABIG84_07170 [archaeon]
MVKKVIGIASIVYFVYMFLPVFSLGLSALITPYFLLGLAYLVAGYLLLTDGNGMIIAVCGVAILLRLFLNTLDLSIILTLFLNPIALLGDILLPLSMVYYGFFANE